MYVQVDVDIDEILYEAGDSDIEEEAKRRGLFILDTDPAETNIDLRRLICDEFGLNYHTPTNELLKILSKKL